LLAEISVSPSMPAMSCAAYALSAADQTAAWLFATNKPVRWMNSSNLLNLTSERLSNVVIPEIESASLDFESAPYEIGRKSDMRPPATFCAVSQNWLKNAPSARCVCGSDPNANQTNVCRSVSNIWGVNAYGQNYTYTMCHPMVCATANASLTHMVAEVASPYVSFDHNMSLNFKRVMTNSLLRKYDEASVTINSIQPGRLGNAVVFFQAGVLNTTGSSKRALVFAGNSSTALVNGTSLASPNTTSNSTGNSTSNTTSNTTSVVTGNATSNTTAAEIKSLVDEENDPSLQIINIAALNDQPTPPYGMSSLETIVLAVCGGAIFIVMLAIGYTLYSTTIRRARRRLFPSLPSSSEVPYSRI